MKAMVDQGTCIGCGLCCDTCDAVFRMNDDGKAEAYQTVNSEDEPTVQSAIDNCPVSAICWDKSAD